LTTPSHPCNTFYTLGKGDAMVMITVEMLEEALAKAQSELMWEEAE
jgi:hypothetical protein